MQRRTLIAFGLGAAAATTLPALGQVVRAVRAPQLPHPNGQPLHLEPFEVDPGWVQSGQPNFRALEYARSPDGRTLTGLWACDGPCTFEWTFGLDETVHLLEGEVHVRYQGQSFQLRPGGTAAFQAETRAVWHVPSHARKTFTLHEPGRLTRWTRRGARALGWL